MSFCACLAAARWHSIRLQSRSRIFSNVKREQEKYSAIKSAENAGEVELKGFCGYFCVTQEYVRKSATSHPI